MRYRNCKFCQATGRRGCLACESEAEKDYKKEFPDGPKPIASFTFDSEQGKIDALKAIFGAITKGTQLADEDAERRITENSDVGAILRHAAESQGTESVRRAIAAQHRDQMIAEEIRNLNP